jgi:GntR family transcriptional regulator, transcriptional repressor for pyruvate dehydrogenase complex
MPDDLSFEPVRRTRLSQQIVVEVCRLIRQGRFQAGDTLPAERDLAEQLQVSRASLREALRALEIAGIIESRHGGGTYVRDFSDFGIESPLALILEASGDIVGDLWEVRIIFEPAVAARAAGRAIPADIEKLEMALERQKDVYGSPGQGQNDDALQLDRHFHTVLAEASHNMVAVRVVQLINRLLHDGRSHFVTSMDRRRQAYARHVEIVEAVSTGDARLAHDVMLAHLHEVEEFILRDVIDKSPDDDADAPVFSK